MNEWPPHFGEMQLPTGASTDDMRWQQGHEDGGEECDPASSDPIYISGWCHGFCEARQTSDEGAVMEYRKRMKSLSPPQARYVPR